MATDEDGRPRYVRLADEVAAAIEAGTYRPGDRIPSVRALRERHAVSVSTVLEALRVLEDRGLVRSRPRAGHYVEPRPAVRRADPQPTLPSQRARRVDASLAVRLNLGIGNPQQPTLGAAVQGPELMPVAALNRLLGQAFRLRPTESHSYDSPPGSPELRRAIVARADAGFTATADEVVITSGAKEAVYLSIRAVTRPGDTVVVESPAYYALIDVVASLGLKVVEVPGHPRTGIDLDVLERVLARRPIAAVALVSNFSNPTGSCMTDVDKARLVDLITAHQVPLVEDDVYGDLAFDGLRPKAIKAFDREGLVLYCGSSSKTLSPGLRVGWSLPGRFQDAVEHLKLVVNQATATAPQLAVAAYLESGGYDRHLRRVRIAYRDQMARTIDAVVRHLPPETRHTDPRGGHVLWVQLPAGSDALALAAAAEREGVHVAPGPMFSPSGGYRDCIRLNTGFPFTDRTDAQIATLARLLPETGELG